MGGYEEEEMVGAKSMKTGAGTHPKTGLKPFFVFQQGSQEWLTLSRPVPHQRSGGRPWEPRTSIERVASDNRVLNSNLVGGSEKVNRAQ